MKARQGIATLLGFALLAMYSTSGRAAERPGQTMADVTARLTLASKHAAALEEALDRQAPPAAPPAPDIAEAVPDGHNLGPGQEGGGYPAEGAVARPRRAARKITAEMTSTLDALEAAVREAKALARGSEYLDPGIEHVLTNAQRIRADSDPSADAVSLSQEIAIELVALANNARILEAEADLHAASAALGGNRTDAFHNHLGAAVQVLGEAQNQGAYHLEDDMAALRVILARLKGGALPREAVTADAVDELIGDVHEHLADLRGE
jgi:hypothetical protein